MPSADADSPRKMLPPPMTSATSSPISTTSAISAHIFETVWGVNTYLFFPGERLAAELEQYALVFEFGHVLSLF